MKRTKKIRTREGVETIYPDGTSSFCYNRKVVLEKVRKVRVFKWGQKGMIISKDKKTGRILGYKMVKHSSKEYKDFKAKERKRKPSASTSKQ